MSTKKTQLTYSVIVDEEYGYKRTHIRICERPIVDLVERLQRTLVNGPDGFSGETQEKKEKAFEDVKVLTLAYAYEGAMNWNTRQPSIEEPVDTKSRVFFCWA